jgi:hypothetical protein
VERFVQIDVWLRLSGLIDIECWGFCNVLADLAVVIFRVSGTFETPQHPGRHIELQPRKPNDQNLYRLVQKASLSFLVTSIDRTITWKGRSWAKQTGDQLRRDLRFSQRRLWRALLLGYNAVQSVTSQSTFRRNMAATCSSETSVDFQRTIWRYIPKDRTLYNHRCENLKSYVTVTWFKLVQPYRNPTVWTCTALLYMNYTLVWFDVVDCSSTLHQRSKHSSLKILLQNKDHTVWTGQPCFYIITYV